MFPHLTEGSYARTDLQTLRGFEGYEDISMSACNAWNEFVGKPGAIKKLCSRSWVNL